MAALTFTATKKLELPVAYGVTNCFVAYGLLNIGSSYTTGGEPLAIADIGTDCAVIQRVFLGKSVNQLIDAQWDGSAGVVCRNNVGSQIADTTDLSAAGYSIPAVIVYT